MVLCKLNNRLCEVENLYIIDVNTAPLQYAYSGCGDIGHDNLLPVIFQVEVLMLLAQRQFQSRAWTW